MINSTRSLIGLLILTLAQVSFSILTLEELKSKAAAAKVKIDEILDGIEKKWSIKEFPSFLKSVAMHHTGWEVLKV